MWLDMPDLQSGEREECGQGVKSKHASSDVKDEITNLVNWPSLFSRGRARVLRKGRFDRLTTKSLPGAASRGDPQQRHCWKSRDNRQAGSCNLYSEFVYDPKSMHGAGCGSNYRDGG
jgi:hypothetical protein